MAERRMFSRTITDSDKFLDMPKSAQSLYFQLGMHSDDDGFIDNVKSLVRMFGAADSDLKLLLTKNFLLKFETGVIVIKDWPINNSIRADRHHPTRYVSEFDQLTIADDKSYRKKTQLEISEKSYRND